MPEKWTGALVGKMHNHGIKRQDVADEMGVSGAYITMLLNSKKKPPGTRERLEKAVEAIIKRQEGA